MSPAALIASAEVFVHLGSTGSKAAPVADEKVTAWP
jgi:hypothetical protein